MKRICISEFLNKNGELVDVGGTCFEKNQMFGWYW